MRRILLLFIPLAGIAQPVWQENFQDGDFKNNPTWNGDTSAYSVNSSYQLQLSDNGAGEALLTTPSTNMVEAQWEWYTHLDFNPSSSNYCSVYLANTQANLSGVGYYVRLGGSSSDRISLYRQDLGSSELIFESRDDWLDLNQVEVRVRVQRDSLGNWNLWADTSTVGNFQHIGSGLDSTYPGSSFFGVKCRYTSTRADKFFFDDILVSGYPYQDNRPPKLLSYQLPDSAHLHLNFSEKLDSATATDIGNYLLSSGQLPVQAQLSNSQTIDLTFNPPLNANEAYTLQIDGLTDLSNNIFSDTIDLLHYVPVKGHILLTEIMADPSPVVGIPPNALPEAEYVEIYNNSGLNLNLKNCSLQIGSNLLKLPDFKLSDSSFAIICRDEVREDFNGIQAVGTNMSSTALINSGTTLALISDKGVVFDQVNYSSGWYGDPNKTGGGWSLEKMDILSACSDKNNWHASLIPLGGSPGLPNSSFILVADSTAPSIRSVGIPKDSSIQIEFSENLFPLEVDSSDINIYPALPISVLTYNSELATLNIEFKQSISEGVIYKLKMSEIGDCRGNGSNDSILFAIPEVAQEGDVLINELLFNPWPGGADFVEIYNASDKVLDFSKLLVGSYDDMGSQIIDARQILSESRLFFPSTYAVICSDPDYLLSHYYVENPALLLNSDALPSMPDDKGSVAIGSNNLSAICDYTFYSEKMHLAFIENTEGVSLERVNFDISAREERAWQSASESAGFATPTYQNSMWLQSGAGENMQLEPSVFSPNGDGYHDVLAIRCKFPSDGFIANLSVYTSEGVLVSELISNTNVRVEEVFIWDGSSDEGIRQSTGIYIIVLERFSEDSARETFREVCVLSL